MNEIIKELRAFAFKIKNHNYATSSFMDKYINKYIIGAIRYKRKLIKQNPEHKNRYKHLTIYDEEIDFMLGLLEKQED